jgi:hypothetical protein
VVTSFEYRLHPVGPIVTGGLLIWPAFMGMDLMRTYRELTSTASDNLGATLLFMTAPPLPFVPPEFHGAPIAAVLVCHVGTPEEAARELAPLRAFGPPAIDMCGPIPYVEVQKIPDMGTPWGLQRYTKSFQLSGLDDDVAEPVARYGSAFTSPLSSLVIPAMGGAVSRVDVNDTAFNHRHTPYHITIFSQWTDPTESERHIAWTREFADALQPFSDGVYVNELGNEEGERLATAYTPETFRRLVELKNRYDPTNLFRVNQNIKPSV